MIIGNPIMLGGGGAKAFAVIGVTYPAGSVCTCSDGAKTLSLKDTGGQGFFLIPYAATWTVTATDGTNTKSESVEITSEGQSESVALSYVYYLYNTGDECTAITGGWEARKQGSLGTFTKKETSLYIIGAPNNGVNAATANPINLTPFTTAKIRLKKVSYGNGSGRFFFSTSSGYVETGSATLSLPAVSEPKLASLDITSLTGSYYAVFISMNNCEIEFDQIWLE